MTNNNFDKSIRKIKKILISDISWFKKLEKIKSIKYVDNNRNKFSKILDNISIQILNEEKRDIDNYTKDIAIPIDNVEDLFGYRFEILLTKYLFINSDIELENKFKNMTTSNNKNKLSYNESSKTYSNRSKKFISYYSSEVPSKTKFDKILRRGRSKTISGFDTYIRRETRLPSKSICIN